MPENLTAKQRRVIQEMLSNLTTTQAAAAAGVSRDTLYRWMREPLFKAELQKATGAALENLSRGLVSVGNKAITVLSDAMGDVDTPAAAKIRAADVVLSRLLQLREMVDLEGRIAELENQVNK